MLREFHYRRPTGVVSGWCQSQPQDSEQGGGV
jgi:hypothetical protein